VRHPYLTLEQRYIQQWHGAQKGLIGAVLRGLGAIELKSIHCTPSTNPKWVYNFNIATPSLAAGAWQSHHRFALELQQNCEAEE
jgi:hypothetical protein